MSETIDFFNCDTTTLIKSYQTLDIGQEGFIDTVKKIGAKAVEIIEDIIKFFKDLFFKFLNFIKKILGIKSKDIEDAKEEYKNTDEKEKEDIKKTVMKNLKDYLSEETTQALTHDELNKIFDYILDVIDNTRQIFEDFDRGKSRDDLYDKVENNDFNILKTLLDEKLHKKFSLPSNPELEKLINLENFNIKLAKRPALKVLEENYNDLNIEESDPIEFHSKMLETFNKIGQHVSKKGLELIKDIDSFVPLLKKICDRSIDNQYTDENEISDIGDKNAKIMSNLFKFVIKYLESVQYIIYFSCRNEINLFNKVISKFEKEFIASLKNTKNFGNRITPEEYEEIANELKSVSPVATVEGIPVYKNSDIADVLFLIYENHNNDDTYDAVRKLANHLFRSDNDYNCCVAILNKFKSPIIAITTPLFNESSKDELKFIYYHEYGHLVHNHPVMKITGLAKAFGENSKAGRKYISGAMRTLHQEHQADMVGVKYTNKDIAIDALSNLIKFTKKEGGFNTSCIKEIERRIKLIEKDIAKGFTGEEHFYYNFKNDNLNIGKEDFL